MVRMDSRGVHVGWAIPAGQGWGFGYVQQPQSGLSLVILLYIERAVGCQLITG